jgi:hypothetical protein
MQAPTAGGRGFCVSGLSHLLARKWREPGVEANPTRRGQRRTLSTAASTTGGATQQVAAGLASRQTKSLACRDAMRDERTVIVESERPLSLLGVPVTAAGKLVASHFEISGAAISDAPEADRPPRQSLHFSKVSPRKLRDPQPGSLFSGKFLKRPKIKIIKA